MDKNKIYEKQIFLIRAFFINFALVFVFWFLTMLPAYMMHNIQLGMAINELHILNWLALWEIAGVVLFLIPLAATFWEIRTLKKVL